MTETLQGGQGVKITLLVPVSASQDTAEKHGQWAILRGLDMCCPKGGVLPRPFPKLLSSSVNPSFLGVYDFRNGRLYHLKVKRRTKSKNKIFPVFSPGEGNGNPLQYSFLENPMDMGAWRGIVHGTAKCRIQLSANTQVILAVSWQTFLILMFEGKGVI